MGHDNHWDTGTALLPLVRCWLVTRSAAPAPGAAGPGWPGGWSPAPRSWPSSSAAASCGSWGSWCRPAPAQAASPPWPPAAPACWPPPPQPRPRSRKRPWRLEAAEPGCWSLEGCWGHPGSGPGTTININTVVGGGGVTEYLQNLVGI